MATTDAPAQGMEGGFARLQKNANTLPSNTVATPLRPNAAGAPTNFFHQGIYLGKLGDHALLLRLYSNNGTPSAASTDATIGNYRISARPMALNANTGNLVDSGLAGETSRSAANAAIAVTMPAAAVTNTIYLPRFAVVAKSILQRNGKYEVYLAEPQIDDASAPNTGNGSVYSNLIGMKLVRFVFDPNAETWTRETPTVANVPQLSELLFNSNGASVNTGTSGLNTSTSYGSLNLLSSFTLNIKDKPHILFMITGTAYRQDTNVAAHYDSTVQLLYRIESDGSLTFVSKNNTPFILGQNDVMYGYACSQDYKSIYFIGEKRIIRGRFDEGAMAYVYSNEYAIDALSIHVAEDETLTAYGRDYSLYRLRPYEAAAVRLYWDNVPEYDVAGVDATIGLGVVDGLGNRMVTTIQLDLDGPGKFKNGQRTIQVKTLADADLKVPVTVTGIGSLYCTPSAV